MKKSVIHTPHDKLFKTSLQIPEVSKEFLELFLPDNVKNKLDFNTITYCQTTFIDDSLRLSQTDVLFKCQIAKKNAYIYILAEHESEIDLLISFWLTKYLVSIWDWHIKKMGKSKALPLPQIIPMVFYTGDKEYTAKRELWQLFGSNCETMKKVLQSPFHLVEVGKIPERILTSHIYAGTMGFIIRKQFKKHLRHELLKIIENLNQLENNHHQYVIQLIKYFLNIDEKNHTIDELLKIVQNKLSPKLEKTMSSLAEKLKSEGREEGREEGKIEMIMDMLVNGVDPRFISKNTGYPLEKIKSLQKELASDITTV